MTSSFEIINMYKCAGLMIRQTNRKWLKQNGKILQTFFKRKIILC